MDLRIDGSSSSATEGALARTAQGGAGEAARRAALELLDEDALRQLLASEPVIEQAKGLLMGYYRISPDEAFAVLRRWSGFGHVKVRDLAVRLVQVATRPGPGPLDPLIGLADGSDHPAREG